jgi:ATP-dependent Clp protease ATP-binding subunit ClpC
MRNRRGADADAARRVAAEDLAAAARAAAQSIAERFGSDYPEFAALADDEEFLRLSGRLAEPDVTFATVERLGRASNPIVAAMAHRAASLRDDVPPEWLGWAFRRLKQAYAGEVLFLLQAIERHDKPPFLARVLARADEDWSQGWLLEVVIDFVERRVRAGERLTAAELDAAVSEPDERLVVDAVAAVADALPRETADELEQWRQQRAPLAFFKSFGRIWERRLDMPTLTTVGGRAAVVRELQSVLRRQGGPRSALVVGEHGVGKSALIRQALREFQVEGWLIFEAGGLDVLAGQRYVGELEGRVHEIVAHAGGGRVVWVMPAFEDALWAGQHSRSERGLLDALRPFVETGQLAIVGELEPAAYELLRQQRPRITSLFETLRLEPLNPEEAIAVAQDWRNRTGADIDDVTIGDAQELAAQYLAGAGSPAGLLRLLKATLAAAATPDESLRSEQVLETLSEATGLPLHVVDPETPLDLDEVRQFFSTRVLGQPEAVDCLVDRIALIKAKLTDPTRPLGVFLFVGPTGTGKTELAKVLAEFLFGSSDRLVRLDMSEFQTQESFERLLADASSDAEAATLISSVRAKPFSVVLLDEFEKAHRNFWSVFLQLFDDGRLTDHQGRTVDFRQCVVILTTNMGAAVQRSSPLGFGAERGGSFRPATVERELSRAFRPEFLNRIDRVVVFRPFEREQMRMLLERELGLVLQRRGFRERPWAVEWDEAALDLLVQKGFSAELGARQLKRAVEHHLLAPLAAAIVSRSFPEGDQFLFVTARDDQIDVTFVDPDAEQADPSALPQPASLRLEHLVLSASGGPEESEFLRTETERLRAIVDGDGWRGRKERDLEAMRSKAFWESSERFAVLGRIEYVDRVEAALRTAEKLSTRLARTRRDGHGSARDLVKLLAQRLYLLDRACTSTDASGPADAIVEVRAPTVDRPEEDCALRLRDMYQAWGRRRGMRVQRLRSESSHLLAISGIGAYPILAAETGLHVFEIPKRKYSFGRMAVRVTVAPLPSAAPGTDAELLARSALAGLPPSTTIVRRYRTGPSPLVRDSVHEWRTGRLDRVLAGDFDLISAR